MITASGLICLIWFRKNKISFSENGFVPNRKILFATNATLSSCVSRDEDNNTKTFLFQILQKLMTCRKNDIMVNANKQNRLI